MSRNRSTSCALALLAAAVALSNTRTATAASVLPFGVQNDVAMSTVLGWGWTVAYRGDYNQTLSISSMFANATGDYVMLAAIRDGSSTFDVLAAGLQSEVRTVTGHNQTHVSNGVGGYYNASSLGFAGPTDTIFQTTADVNGSSYIGQASERDRLSWHTQGSGSGPTEVNGGWRSGSNIYLNDSTDWDRVVLTMSLTPADETPVAPLPTAAWAGMALLGKLGLTRRRA